MTRIILLVAAVAAVLFVTACHPVERPEFEDLMQRHQLLVDSLNHWAPEVYDWQGRTYQTICEIAELVDPNGDQDYSDIGAATHAYCGPGGGGSPDAPPDWGA